jgi:hypothetical protein
MWKGALILEQINFLRTYQLAGLKKWQEGYIAAFFFQSHPYITLAALVGLYRAATNLDRKILIMAWFGGLAFFLELKRLRYLLPLLPFFTLTAAYGLQMITHARIRRYIAYCGVLSSLVISIWVYNPFLEKTSMSNLQQAGRFLDTLDAEAVEVFCLPQVHSLGNTSVAVPILDLYTDRIIYQQQEWITEEGFRRAQNVSLRFTWELNQPAYYRDKKYVDQKLPLVIISAESIDKIPPQLVDKYPAARLVRKFSNTSSIFRYQTFVTVFGTI